MFRCLVTFTFIFFLHFFTSFFLYGHCFDRQIYELNNSQNNSTNNSLVSVCSFCSPNSTNANNADCLDSGTDFIIHYLTLAFVVSFIISLLLELIVAEVRNGAENGKCCAGYKSLRWIGDFDETLLETKYIISMITEPTNTEPTLSNFLRKPQTKTLIFQIKTSGTPCVFLNSNTCESFKITICKKPTISNPNSTPEFLYPFEVPDTMIEFQNPESNKPLKTEVRKLANANKHFYQSYKLTWSDGVIKLFFYPIKSSVYSTRLLNESGEYEILSLKSDGLEVSEVRVGTEEGAGFWGFEEEKMIGF